VSGVCYKVEGAKVRAQCLAPFGGAAAGYHAVIMHHQATPDLACGQTHQTGCEPSLLDWNWDRFA
jgi:hypothetical protein